MFDRKKNSRPHGDSSVQEKTRRQAIIKEQKTAQGGDDRLDIQNHVHHGGIAFFQSESEKNCADGRTREPGKDEKSPGAPVYFGELASLVEKQGQEPDEDEHMFPEDDDAGIEEIVQRNAPGTFRSPQRRAQSDQPRPVARRSVQTHGLSLSQSTPRNKSQSRIVWCFRPLDSPNPAPTPRLTLSES